VTFVIAHRGASRSHRENTIAAFRAARTAGADAVELDVRPCADGVLVVHHDAVLADGRPVMAVSRRDLPDAIPDLSAALAACQGMWVNVEIKADVVDQSGWVGHVAVARFVDDVVALVEDRGDTDRVLYSSFAVEVVERCREVGPATVRTGLLCHSPTAEAIAACLGSGHEAIHPFADGLARDDVERCHSLGLAVNTWTCNEASAMDRLIDWRVDGICTDVPELLVARLAARGDRVTPHGAPD
jgi:glycerophosphoryl diester phosphodiesterase